MKILGIETATAVCGAAVAADGLVAAEKFVDAPQVHAEKLLVLIDTVLRGAAAPAASIDAIAISIGPGSFTGLRIGLSAAKGLSMALGKPLVAVPTLAAVALHVLRSEHLTEGSLIITALESRRDEIFWGCYRVHEGLPVEDQPAAALPIAEAASRVRALGPVVLAGNGAEALHAALGDRSTPVVLPPVEHRRCSAAAVALLGGISFERHDIADIASVEPLYLKEFYTTAKPLQTN